MGYGTTNSHGLAKDDPLKKERMLQTKCKPLYVSFAKVLLYCYIFVSNKYNFNITRFGCFCIKYVFKSPYSGLRNVFRLAKHDMRRPPCIASWPSRSMVRLAALLRLADSRLA